MNSKDFIIDKMHQFVGVFPSTRIRYDYHLLSKTHTLEVVPAEIYHLDKAFKKWEESLVFEFIDSFPTESLSLVTDDSFFGIDKIDFELLGSHFYKTPTTNTTTNTVVEHFYTGLQETIWDLFKDFKPDYNAALRTNNIGSSSMPSIIELEKINTTSIEPFPGVLADNSMPVISESFDSDIESNTYALAA